MSEPIEIKLDNKEVESRLLDLAKRSENLRPLMKNIAGIYAYTTKKKLKKRADLISGQNYRNQQLSNGQKINSGPA